MSDRYPEPVSPSYRARVLKVSGRYRSHGVKDEPESHMNISVPHQHLEANKSAGRPVQSLISALTSGGLGGPMIRWAARVSIPAPWD